MGVGKGLDECYPRIESILKDYLVFRMTEISN